jgi:hypothetical protein
LDASNFVFATGSSPAERMRITSDGNVGIGTSSPNKRLTVNSATNDVEVLRINAPGGGGGTQAKADIGFGYYDGVTEASAAIGFEEATAASTGGVLLFKTRPDGSSDSTRPTERMRIDSSGNVGIGTSSPNSNGGASAKVLHINSPNVDDWSITHYTNGSTGSAASDGLIVGNIGSSSYIFNYESSPLIFGTAAAERMRIDSSGNLLVGTTSVGSYTSGIVVGNSSAAKAVTLPVNGGGATFNGVDTVNSASSGFSMGHITTTNRLQMRVGSTGGVELASGGTSWSAISDERLKDIIEPIENAVEKVSSLRAVIGKYKVDEEGTRRSFLIAQDVQAVLPEAVSTTKIAMDDDAEYLSVSYTDTIPLLVAAIQEQQAIINDLKARIETLESK